MGSAGGKGVDVCLLCHWRVTIEPQPVLTVAHEVAIPTKDIVGRLYAFRDHFLVT